ncbi:DNA polymerase III subunit delta' [candidate division KSB1 bacterium]|nr:DNA polymerase III subunit delta' [candidate division KSB1 bacterium]
MIGQDKVKEILLRTLSRKRIPHALLFHGPKGVGKEAMALELARAFICQEDELYACNQCSDCHRIAHLTHPDVYFIFPFTGKITVDEEKAILKSVVDNPYMRSNPWATPSISIEQIRQLKKESSLSTFENKGRVVIIAEAHLMTPEAANSLLKLLEEPPSKMYLILTSSNHMALLPTIISRCQCLRFDPIEWRDIAAALTQRASVEESQANIIAKISSGSYRRAIELLDEDIDNKRTKVLDLLRAIIKNDFERLLAMEELVKSEEKNEIKELLNLLLLWFRDALIYIEGEANNSTIINIDQIDILDKFCHSFETLDVKRITDEIETAIQLIDRNVYINLIILNLFYRLKHNLRRK